MSEQVANGYQTPATVARAALNSEYDPVDMSEAIEMIAYLRKKVKELTGDQVPMPRMTQTLSRLYRCLAARPEAVSKDALYAAVYGDKKTVEKKTIDVHVCKLRKFLPPGEEILTSWGFGYELVRRP